MTQFGLEERHWQAVQDLLVKPLHNAGCQVWVFGSRARGDHQKFSDLDVLVAGKPGDTLLGQIREDLEESMLPIKVDIVLEHELADSYRASVERDRVPLASF